MAHELSASRTYPVDVATAFGTVLHAPLPVVFARRYAAIPPVRETRGQSDGWGAAGESRTVVLADGGTLLETLTSVGQPHFFAYRLSEVRGMLQPLVAGVDGRFSFVPAGTGVRVTWSWTVEPRGRAGASVMPIFARMWRGYARQALEQLEQVLVPGTAP